MRKRIKDKNGFTYSLADDGMYYPNITLPEEMNFDIGRFGRMRGRYLKENKVNYFNTLLISGKLNQYLRDVNTECEDMIEILSERMMIRQGITEQMKEADHMKWVGLTNNIRLQVEKFVVKDLIFS